jgi:hypothetical protein
MSPEKMTPEQRQTVIEALSQIMEIGLRINLETDFACWVTVSGHVDGFQVSVAQSKTNYNTKLTAHEFYYFRDYADDKGFADFLEASKIAIDDLNKILSSKWTNMYTAYCNLIDMSCSQVFTSEAAAKRWVSKMKAKYDKVHAMTGYTCQPVKS